MAFSLPCPLQSTFFRYRRILQRKTGNASSSCRTASARNSLFYICQKWEILAPQCSLTSDYTSQYIAKKFHINIKLCSLSSKWKYFTTPKHPEKLTGILWTDPSSILLTLLIIEFFNVPAPLIRTILSKSQTSSLIASSRFQDLDNQFWI